MRYYEIVHRLKVQTATHRIAWDKRHLQHDAGQIQPSGGRLRVSGDAAKAQPHSAGTVSHHAPVPHPGRHCFVE